MGFKKWKWRAFQGPVSPCLETGPLLDVEEATDPECGSTIPAELQIEDELPVPVKVQSQQSWTTASGEVKRPLLADPALPESFRVALTSFTRFSGELIRAVTLSDVTEGMGEVLTRSATADGFQKSRPSTTIHDFVSYNWSTGRWSQYLVLAVHYNLQMATVALYLFAILVAYLTAMGWLPVFRVSQPSGTFCFFSMIAGYAAFLVFLCFGNELRQLFPIEPRLLFLDKLCIPRADEKGMVQAIKGMPAFLECSDQMLVVYSPDVYLRRLWTVYELASFLTLHRDSSRIAMCPVFKVQRLLVCSATILLGSLLTYGVGAICPENSLHQVIYPALEGCRTLLVFLLCFFTVRVWESEAQCAQPIINDFSVQTAKCFVEDDRALVQANICFFMRSLNKVPHTASDDTALDAFDMLVKRELPSALRTSLRQSLMHYGYILAVTSGLFLLQLDKAAARFSTGGSWPLALAALLEGFCLNFAVCPLWNWLLFQALNTKQNEAGSTVTLWRSLLFALPLAIVFYLPVPLGKVLAETFEMPIFACILLGAYSCFLTAVALMLYKPPQKRKPSLSKKVSAETQEGLRSPADEEVVPLTREEITELPQESEEELALHPASDPQAEEDAAPPEDVAAPEENGDGEEEAAQKEETAPPNDEVVLTLEEEAAAPELPPAMEDPEAPRSHKVGV